MPLIRSLTFAVALVVGMTACSTSDSTTTTIEASGDDGAASTSTEAAATSGGSTTSATAEASSGDDTAAGTLESPVPGGEFAQVGDWKVRVIEVTHDGTDLVLEENQFNDPPEEGDQFFIATLEAEYTGTESGSFWIDMTWKALGPSAVAYESFEATCGTFPDSISDAGETFPGGVVTGNVCWSVSAADAADLVMLLEDAFSFDDSAREVYRLTDADTG
jgi:hypothetical protein